MSKDIAPIVANTFSQTNRLELERRSRAAGLTFTEPSKTLQGPKADADINNIAKAFGLNAKNMPIPPEIFDPRHYADLSEVPDLQEALNLVNEAQRQFMTLRPELRAMFNHSPAALWEWVSDPQNAQQAVDLGLLSANPPPVVPKAPEGP